MSEDELAVWMDAYMWIINNLNNSQWTPVPEWVRTGYKLDHKIKAVCKGGFFGTPVAVRGMDEFISRLNKEN